MVDQAAPASRLDALVGAFASPAAQAQQVQVHPELPERPRLAPNVQLMGEMKESAFKDAPYLISRDGKFLQVTKLIHKIAENIDGERSYDDIAAAASTSYDRQIDAAEVSQLVATNLIPVGIVLKADGTQAPAPATSASALQVNLKMKMLPPRVINIFTGILGILYLPPVMLGIFAFSIATQAWIFFVHGLGGGLQQTFFESGMLLAVLGIVVAAAAFHELGHAAALRYGGGQVGGMGAGLYIVYPCFYTDVTDNYRLPRWSRVRTDLGGFYFNLVFGIGLLGLFLITGEEVFLLGVAIIDIEIIHQLLPFVRLDGYWALADITGIPDFFSHILPFLRTVLPSWVPLPQGRSMPALKTWARVFFAGYILLTVPLLLFLFFLMFRTLPRIIATAVSAVGEQFAKIGPAVNDVDVLTLSATLVQIVLLVLPSIGISLLLAKLARKFARFMWNWSKPTAARRACGALATLAIVAMFAFLWLPQIGLPGFEPTATSQAFVGPFEPIRPNERLTIQQVVRNEPPPPPVSPNRGGDRGDEQPAGAPPGATPGSTPSATATPRPSGSATPVSTPASTLTPVSTSRSGVSGTAIPTRSRPTSVPTTGLTPTPDIPRNAPTPTP